MISELILYDRDKGHQLRGLNIWFEDYSER